MQLRRVLNTALVVGTTSVELANNVGGAPFLGPVAVLLSEIGKVCEQIRVHKAQCRLLIRRVQIIIDALRDGSGLTEPKLREAADTLETLLVPIHNKMVEWANWSLVRAFWKRDEVSTGITNAFENIKTYQERFHIQAQMITIEKLDENRLIQQSDNADIRAALQEILTNQTHTNNLFQMHLAGELSPAKEVMRAAQTELHEHSRDSVTYKEYGGYVLNLYSSVGVLPSLPNLSHEIVKTEGPIAGGVYSDVFLGLWLGNVRVALKSLREVKISDPRAKKRFEQEIAIWHTLEHPNILRFLGIADNLGPHLCVVSPWQSNGNALEYTKKHPDIDRIQLLLGAARGVEYLHTRNMPVVHGNLKCANILVSENGEALISDFGLSRVIENITDISAHITLTSTGGNRWCAPELMECTSNTSPNMATDVYAFSMCIMECLTSNKPFEDLKRDARVVVGVVNKERPSRPKKNVWDKWFNNRLWNLLEACWNHEPSHRPTMSEVAVELSIVGQEMIVRREQNVPQ